jgi:prevent-host-death family protein
MAYEIPVTRARAELADLINRVVYGGERVVVTRHGKPLVALVSAADLRLLDEGGDLGETGEGRGEEASEAPVIRAVSTVHEAASAQGEQHRFGITAHHQGPGGSPASHHG